MLCDTVYQFDHGRVKKVVSWKSKNTVGVRRNSNLKIESRFPCKKKKSVVLCVAVKNIIKKEAVL